MTNLELQTLEAVKTVSRAIVKHIDRTNDTERLWEQRRYEIARDLYVQYATMTAQQCVDRAEELIKALRK